MTNMAGDFSERKDAAFSKGKKIFQVSIFLGEHRMVLFVQYFLKSDEFVQLEKIYIFLFLSFFEHQLVFFTLALVHLLSDLFLVNKVSTMCTEFF